MVPYHFLNQDDFQEVFYNGELVEIVVAGIQTLDRSKLKYVEQSWFHSLPFGLSGRLLSPVEQPIQISLVLRKLSIKISSTVSL